MAIVRYVLVKLRPGVTSTRSSGSSARSDYVKAAQNPSIVSYRTHRITDLDTGIEGGPWDFMERIEVTSQAEYEKQAATAARNSSTCSTRSTSTVRRPSRSGPSGSSPEDWHGRELWQS